MRELRVRLLELLAENRLRGGEGYEAPCGGPRGVLMRKGFHG